MSHYAAPHRIGTTGSRQKSSQRANNEKFYENRRITHRSKPMYDLLSRLKTTTGQNLFAEIFSTR